MTPLASFITSFVALFVVVEPLRGTATVQRFIGPATLAVVLRVFGLLLAALAIQSIVRGLTSLLA